MSIPLWGTVLSPIVTHAGFTVPRAAGENPSSLSLALVALATIAVFGAYYRAPRKDVSERRDSQHKPPRRAA